MTRKHRLNRESTSRLLRVGLEPETPSDGNQGREDLLLDLLGSKLPPDLALIHSLPAMVKSLSEDLAALSGSSLNDLLTDPQTKPTLLRQIKDYAKERGSASANEVDRDVALAIYYAAIAAAMVNHKARISSHGPAHLAEAFRTLTRHEWVPQGLRLLFEEAMRHCEGRV
jgi:hypothetical protein